MVAKDDPNRIYTNYYLASGAQTEKTYQTQINTSPNGELLAYCVGNVVIVRKQENYLKDGVLIFQKHKCRTTCVDFAPNGVFAASADEQGFMKIWFIDDGTEKFSYQVMNSKILGIHWDETSKRILVYGMSGKKGFSRYVTWDTCNTMGEIIGMTKNVISGDLKRGGKPYYAAIASEDLSLRIYSGNNLTPKYTNNDHKRYISGIRFNLKGDQFATVGMEKRICVYETETGNLLYEIPKDHESQHTNCIISVVWLTNDIICTCSMDKTVKLWDLKEKTCKTLKVSEVQSDDDFDRFR